MSNVYIARQPIFEANLKLYGYELLYRKSQNNYYEGTDDDSATATLLDDLFFLDFDELVESKRGFINFSRNLIMDDVPLMLPQKNLIVEILERVDVDEDVIEKCKAYKKQGYTLAIDDFIFGHKNKLYDELIDIVDIIKVEYSIETLAQQMKLIGQYRSSITFLAERIETQDDFAIAKNMGYTLFQGYFFSKPIMHNAKSIGTLSENLILILNDLNVKEPNFESIAKKVEIDIELAYKLLKLVNSVYYGVRYSIKSIQHALTQLGQKELIRWINIMIIKDMHTVENSELIKVSLIRGKMLGLLSQKMKKRGNESDFFLVGIFSSIDSLLNQDMRKILSGLPLNDEVKQALLGEKNMLRNALDSVINFEFLNWDDVDSFLSGISVEKSDFMQIYGEALKWARQIMQN